MAKFIDLDLIIDSISDKMSGEAALPRSLIRSASVEPDFDFSEVLKKQADKFYDDVLDSHPDRTRLDGLNHDVLSGNERQKQALRALGLDKRTKLASCAAELKVIAEKADAAGFKKQAADLRYVASKLV